jgi:hypothetical protein
MIVLRIDLVDRVYRLTRDPGFQEEKFSSLYLPIRWTKPQLITLLDLRIDFLIKQRYTSQKVTHSDILPDFIGGEPAIDYILARTLMRPRDIIQFFNLCIDEAVDSPTISREMVLNAEREYSRGRFDSLQDEWLADYPNLKFWVGLITGKGSQLFVEDIDLSDIEDRCLSYDDKFSNELSYGATDKLSLEVIQVLNHGEPCVRLRTALIMCLFTIGVIGVELEGRSKPIWSYEQRRNLDVEEITPITILHIHPCFWSALGIRNPATAR